MSNNPHSLTSVNIPSNPSKIVEAKLKKEIETLDFSFKYFDRNHELFNLGDHLTRPIAVQSDWFLDLLDTLKEASNLKITDFKQKYDMHPLQEDGSNIKDKDKLEQFEYWSFDVTKQSRVIGFKINNRFYIQWLDVHHNHYNSAGYGKATYYCKPFSIIDQVHNECEQLKLENSKLKEENDIYLCMCDNCPSYAKNT